MITASEGAPPFRQDMFMAMAEGRKTATSRNSRYANGRYMYQGSGIEVIIELYSATRLRLEVIAQEHYLEEGVDSPQAFRDIWAEIHPRKGWRPLDKAWFHKFSVLEVRRLG